MTFYLRAVTRAYSAVVAIEVLEFAPMVEALLVETNVKMSRPYPRVHRQDVATSIAGQSFVPWSRII